MVSINYKLEILTTFVRLVNSGYRQKFAYWKVGSLPKVEVRTIRNPKHSNNFFLFVFLVEI